MAVTSKPRENGDVCIGSVPGDTAETLRPQGLQGRGSKYTAPYIVTPLSPIPNTAHPDRLRFDKVENIILAAAFAREVGNPLNHFLTVKCPAYANPDVLFPALRTKLQDWLVYNEGAAAFVWSVESNDGPHTHILLHVSKPNKPKCQKLVRKWVKEILGVRHLSKGAINFKAIRGYDEQVRNLLRYILKRADNDTRHFIGCDTKYDCGPTVVGKAVGVSQAINNKARKLAGGVQSSGCRGVSRVMREAAEISNADSIARGQHENVVLLK